MARKGAYVIIDLTGYDITAAGTYKVTVPGIFKKLSKTNKPVLVSGLTIAGKTYRDVLTECQASGANLVVYLNHIAWTGPAGAATKVDLTIKSDDSVSAV